MIILYATAGHLENPVVGIERIGAVDFAQIDPQEWSEGDIASAEAGTWSVDGATGDMSGMTGGGDLTWNLDGQQIVYSGQVSES